MSVLNQAGQRSCPYIILRVRRGREWCIARICGSEGCWVNTLVTSRLTPAVRRREAAHSAGQFEQPIVQFLEPLVGGTTPRTGVVFRYGAVRADHDVQWQLRADRARVAERIDQLFGRVIECDRVAQVHEI